VLPSHMETKTGISMGLYEDERSRSKKYLDRIMYMDQLR